MATPMATPKPTPKPTRAPSQPSLLQLLRGLLRVPRWPQKLRVEELGAAEGCSSPGEPPNWEHWEDARGKNHPAAWAPCCPSPLQLLRGLLGSLWGTRKPREEELGAAGGRSSPGQRWDGASGESTESLLGKPEELSTSGRELLGPGPCWGPALAATQPSSQRAARRGRPRRDIPGAKLCTCKSRGGGEAGPQGRLAAVSPREGQGGAGRAAADPRQVGFARLGVIESSSPPTSSKL